MKTLASIAELRSNLDHVRKKGLRVALVPTMGNLHEGHLTLVRRARLEADVVVVSIFVNPLQFGANEDLDNYPRTLAADKEKLFGEGTDFLFTPQVDEIYPDGMAAATKVCVPGLTETLCGASRPGHFDGVTTVVAKLFNIVQPDVAVFGKKDFQQLTVIEKMVSDLCMRIQIIGEETVRADDQLALSSRNGYLNPAERATAPVIHQVLQGCREAIACGFDSYTSLEAHAADQLQQAGFVPDYVAIRDARTLDAVTLDTETIVILAAARLGSTRLIDNVTLAVNPTSDWRMLATN